MVADLNAAPARRQQEVAGAGDCRTGRHHERIPAGGEGGGQDAGAAEGDADHHLRVVGVGGRDAGDTCVKSIKCRRLYNNNKE